MTSSQSGSQSLKTYLYKDGTKCSEDTDYTCDILTYGGDKQRDQKGGMDEVDKVYTNYSTFERVCSLHENYLTKKKILGPLGALSSHLFSHSSTEIFLYVV